MRRAACRLCFRHPLAPPRCSGGGGGAGPACQPLHACNPLPASTRLPVRSGPSARSRRPRRRQLSVVVSLQARRCSVMAPRGERPMGCELARRRFLLTSATGAATVTRQQCSGAPRHWQGRPGGLVPPGGSVPAGTCAPVPAMPPLWDGLSTLLRLFAAPSDPLLLPSPSRDISVYILDHPDTEEFSRE